MRSKTKKVDKNRRKRLEYNYQYDEKKRVARRLGLLPNYPESIVLEKPRGMSQRKFDLLVSKHKLV